MYRASRKIQNFFYMCRGIMSKKPSNFFSGAKVKHALDDIARVFFRVYGFRINVPEERLPEPNRLYIFSRRNLRLNAFLGQFHLAHMLNYITKIASKQAVRERENFFNP